MKYLILILLVFNASILLEAQKNEKDSAYKFIQNLKKQAYLKYATRINCDSNAGSMLEERICANLELQRQDSLLLLEFDSLIKEFILLKDFKRINKMKAAQENWEKYRFSECSKIVDDDGGSLQMVLFMQCATELTIQRRKEIKKWNY